MPPVLVTKEELRLKERERELQTVSVWLEQRDKWQHIANTVTLLLITLNARNSLTSELMKGFLSI
jgi:hypothetical protein